MGIRDSDEPDDPRLGTYARGRPWRSAARQLTSARRDPSPRRLCGRTSGSCAACASQAGAGRHVGRCHQRHFLKSKICSVGLLNQGCASQTIPQKLRPFLGPERGSLLNLLGQCAPVGTTFNNIKKLADTGWPFCFSHFQFSKRISNLQPQRPYDPRM